MKKEQKFVAVALVYDLLGRVLVQKRNSPHNPKAHGKWEFPGGTVKFEEPPEQTAVREVLEETGYTVGVIRLIPVLQSRVWDRKDGSRLHALVVCYEALLISGTGQAQDEDVSEISWHTPEEVFKLDCLEGIHEFLQAVEAK